MTREEIYLDLLTNGMQPGNLQGNGNSPEFIQDYTNWLQSKGQLKKADGSYVAPEWSSLLNQDGTLQDKYKVGDWQNVTANEDALNMYRKSALRDAGQNSEWANLMLDKQKLEQANSMDTAAQMGSQNLLSTLSNLAKSGGLGAGARERAVARTNANTLLDRNKVLRQGQLDRTGILTQDETNRLTGLTNLQNMENQKADTLFKNQQAQMAVDQANKSTLLKEIEAKRMYDAGVYKENMAGWGAGKTADAQSRASSGGGGGGCCFIFLEARYGNGTMDDVVRRFRDENMTTLNKRGYYKLSEVLVPLMRKYSVIKGLVRVTMTDPLVAYGKAYYNKGSKLGFIFKPVVKFWLGMFNYLGQDHEFIRENGETV